MVMICLLGKVERGTAGTLQCHPYPNDYVDTSKQCSHCTFFLGLRRKEGEEVKQHQKFDIRAAVDAFKYAVNMYAFWKPGMEISVLHLLRRQLPSYVFPNGYKGPRPSRLLNGQFEYTTQVGCGERVVSSFDGQLKRKLDPEMSDEMLNSSEKQSPIYVLEEGSLSPQSMSDGRSYCSNKEVRVDSLAISSMERTTTTGSFEPPGDNGSLRNQVSSDEEANREDFVRNLEVGLRYGLSGRNGNGENCGSLSDKTCRASRDLVGGDIIRPIKRRLTNVEWSGRDGGLCVPISDELSKSKCLNMRRIFHKRPLSELEPNVVRHIVKA